MSAIQQVLASLKAAAAAPAWYYTAPGSGSYNTNVNAPSGGNSFGGNITVGQTGNITRIGASFTAVGAVHMFKIALFSNVGSPVMLFDGGTNSCAIGWNDITLGSPYAVTVGEIFQVWGVGVDGNVRFSAQSSSSGWNSNNTIPYASFPTTPITTAISTTVSPGFRIEVTP